MADHVRPIPSDGLTDAPSGVIVGPAVVLRRIVEEVRVFGQHERQQRVVVPRLDMKERADAPLQGSPEARGVEYRVQKVGQDAVARVLPAQMMAVVMARRLYETQPLQRRDETPVLAPGSMAPLVDLIRVDAENGR